MDRLARDAAARYGSGGGNYSDLYGRRGAVASSGGGGGYGDPYSSGRRESRRASYSSSRRSEQPALGRSNGTRRPSRYDVDIAGTRYAAALRNHPEADYQPLSGRAYDDLRRRDRYSQVGLTSSISPYHAPERRPSTMASYHEGRRRANEAQADRARFHNDAIHGYAEDNRRAAQRYVTEDYRRPTSGRRLRPEEVPGRYGGGDLLSLQAAELRRRGNEYHWES